MCARCRLGARLPLRRGRDRPRSTDGRGLGRTLLLLSMVAMAGVGVQRLAVAVAGVLLNSAGRVLLIQERHGARQFGLPGALVNNYESPEETLVREVVLQTDVKVA